MVEKAEKMQKKTEKLLFYWSVVFVTNKIKNKGELIGKQENWQKYAIKFDLEISLLNEMLIFWRFRVPFQIWAWSVGSFGRYSLEVVLFDE